MPIVCGDLSKPVTPPPPAFMLTEFTTTRPPRPKHGAKQGDSTAATLFHKKAYRLPYRLLSFHFRHIFCIK